MFPPQILDDIQDGKQYFSKLNQVYLSDMEFSSCKCNTRELFDLYNILTDLEYKVEIGDFDEDSLGLYVSMMEIIGGEAYTPVPPTDLIIKYGWADSIDHITESFLDDLPFVYLTPTKEIVIPFENSNFKVPVVAIHNEIQIPNYYINLNNPFDRSEIGGSTDLLGVPYSIGRFNVMQGNYIVNITDPILLTKN